MNDEIRDRQQDLNFHYSREERLKKAPKQVRQYYNGEMKLMQGGLIRVLLATKGSKMLFLSIVFIMALCFGISFINNSQNVNQKDGIRYSLNAFSFDETVYVSIKIDENRKYSGQAELNATVNALDKTGTVVDQAVLDGIYTGKESFLRTTFHDYDILEVEVLLENGSTRIPLSAYVEKQ